ncbi:MAG: xylose isomerase, partial [Mariniblastus sp.]
MRKFSMSQFAAPAFPEIEKIKYEGPDSSNPLAFRWYNPEEVVEGKT